MTDRWEAWRADPAMQALATAGAVLFTAVAVRTVTRARGRAWSRRGQRLASSGVAVWFAWSAVGDVVRELSRRGVVGTGAVRAWELGTAWVLGAALVSLAVGLVVRGGVRWRVERRARGRARGRAAPAGAGAGIGAGLAIPDVALVAGAGLDPRVVGRADAIGAGGNRAVRVHPDQRRALARAALARQALRWGVTVALCVGGLLIAGRGPEAAARIAAWLGIDAGRMVAWTLVGAATGVGFASLVVAMRGGARGFGEGMEGVLVGALGAAVLGDGQTAGWIGGGDAGVTAVVQLVVVACAAGQLAGALGPPSLPRAFFGLDGPSAGGEE